MLGGGGKTTHPWKRAFGKSKAIASLLKIAVFLSLLLFLFVYQYIIISYSIFFFEKLFARRKEDVIESTLV